MVHWSWNWGRTIVDLARYSKDSYKELLADLVKYEDYVTEVNIAKTINDRR